MLNMKGRQANAFYEFIQGYFYFCIASDPPIVEYHELQYFTSEEELYKYLFREYSGTDGDKIPQYTITKKKKGVSYYQDHRMGAGKSKVQVRIFHDDNISEVINILKDAVIRDYEGVEIDYLEFLKNVKDIEAVIEFVEIYNNSWNNYW